MLIGYYKKIGDFKMKKIIVLVVLVVFAVTGAFAAKPNFTTKTKSVFGIHIYVNTLPVEDYEELGILEPPALWWQGRYTEVSNFFAKKCKKIYPEANAIVLYIENSKERATAIRVLDIEDKKDSEQPAK